MARGFQLKKWSGLSKPALKTACRRRQKIRTTNNHYEWGNVPVARDMPCLAASTLADRLSTRCRLSTRQFYQDPFLKSVHIIVEELVVTQDRVIVVQVILGYIRF